MKFTFSARSALLASAAALALTACTQANSPTTPGNGTPFTVVVTPPVTGGGGAQSELARLVNNQPTSQLSCDSRFGAGNSTFLPQVAVGAQSINFCSMGGTLTGNLTFAYSEHPILLSGTLFLGNPTDAVSDTFAFGQGQDFISRGRAGIVDLFVVSRGSRVTLRGTAQDPVIFTSRQDYEDDFAPNGSRPRDSGDWGGIAINGRGRLNECTEPTSATPGTDACRQTGEGASGLFGGADDADNSGTFEYIRVQHAGFRFTETNELNSFALQGVGSGTVFRFNQVHRGADDGFEWFGGAVDGDHLVVTGAGDDMYDWTDGWTGSIQFALGVQDVGDDNGIEGDNNGATGISRDASPRSAPRLSNFTLIGDRSTTGGDEGVQLREGTAGSVVNSIVTRFVQGLEFNPAGTGANPTVNSVMLADNIADFSGSGSTLFNAGANNRSFANNTLNGVLPGATELSVPVVTPNSVDSTFQNVSYVGAFGSEATANSNWASGWTTPGSIPASGAASCPAGTTLATETPTSAGFTGRTEARICVISKPVLGDVRLTAGNLYRMDGSTFVGIDRGADPATPLPNGAVGSLTIDAGVTLFGNQTSGLVDLLVVSRGSQIFVNGSAFAPVVMTTRADLANGGAYRQLATGEWGGLALNGRAALNECTQPNTATPGTVACQQSGEGASGLFGGATPTDNSGRLNYLQIRYAGFRFTEENELNALALQGVGSGTNVRYVQVINGADDGIEWFGGTVDAKNVVITGANDDSLDWTDGWSGVVQYAIVRQNVGDDNGIEGDNNGASGISRDTAPRSRPLLSNLTMIGDNNSAGGDEGIQVREGTAGGIVNAIVTNFRQGLEFNPAGTGPNPTVLGLVLTANAANFAGSGQTLFDAGGTANFSFATSTLTAPTGATTPILPGANEQQTASNPRTVCDAIYAGVTDAPNPCSRVDATTYIGAVRDANDRWWAGWTFGL